MNKKCEDLFYTIVKGIAKMAKKFGIDYADAVVDFEFVKMRSVPVIDGIVVAEHSKNILLEVYILNNSIPKKFTNFSLRLGKSMIKMRQ